SLTFHHLLSFPTTPSYLLFLLAPAPTGTYTLSLHDALPIYGALGGDADVRRAEQKDAGRILGVREVFWGGYPDTEVPLSRDLIVDRKSTRLNSSHLGISYAVFCLKKKTENQSLYIER